jgi:hypothetical protein
MNTDDYTITSLAHYVISCDLTTKRYMAAGKSRGESPEALRGYVRQAQMQQLNLKRDVRACLAEGISTDGVRAQYVWGNVPSDIVHQVIAGLEAEHIRDRACLVKSQPTGGLRINGIDV